MHTTDFQFLSSNNNSQIFLAHYAPQQWKGERCESAGETQAVIFVPPFAEEMNRSKRMYVLCSRLLANAGVHAICFDFAGTGDSSGEWGEYGLTDWKANLTDTYNYVRRFSTKTSFVTLRDSALIAFELIKHANIKIERCVLWDPIDNGEALIRQLIRMKIAAAMASDLKKITSKEVLSGIEQSGFLEVGAIMFVPICLMSSGSKMSLIIYKLF